MADSIVRCVNLDWLEVYCLEDDRRFPMNADYFRQHGYFVRERDYGTRVYSEMFTIEDEHGEPWIEVRRNPQSGSSEFTGLSELSCHIRFVNRACYMNRPIRSLAEFILKHDYQYQRLFRIDVAYDFKTFDSGDMPEKFIRRYLEKKYSKVNQCKVRAIGSDAWASFDWESVSWGAPTSMVSTKIYNKTKELQATGCKKPWIVQAWFESKLINDPLNLPDVWRIEFSLKSSAKNWIVIEDSDAKGVKKRAIPHTPELFDGRDRLWQRFLDLAHHYFRFKRVQYKQQPNSAGDRELVRKDACPDKRLFDYSTRNEFYSVEGVSRETSPSVQDERLLRHLVRYRDSHTDSDLRRACAIVIKAIEDEKIRRITPHGIRQEIEAIRLQIATRTSWEYDKVVRVAEEIHQLIEQQEIW